MLLYYITDRKQLDADELRQRSRLLEKIAEAARCGVDYVQLREKDLPAKQLELLAREAVDAIQKYSPRNSQLRTKLLINSRIDVALACAAGGVHLPAGEVSPRTVREIYSRSAGHGKIAPVISVACHDPDEVKQAAQENADLVLFAPVFGKRGYSSTPAGLDALQKACRQNIPVLALGGVTLENSGACMQAGAAGIAAIRLFQENSMEETVRMLRRL